MTDNDLGKKKFIGSLLGAALGDAVGASREGYQMVSMAWAISGSYLGIDGLSPQWLEQLENKNYTSDLAVRLWQVTLAQRQYGVTLNKVTGG